jgi:hypothetical protein
MTFSITIDSKTFTDATKFKEYMKKKRFQEMEDFNPKYTAEGRKKDLDYLINLDNEKHDKESLMYATDNQIYWLSNLNRHLEKLNSL